MARFGAADADCLAGALIAAAGDGIIAIDAAHRIVVFNAAAEELFGYRAADVVGHGLDLLLPARSAATHHARVAAFGRDPEARVAGAGREVRGWHQSGRELRLEISVAKATHEGADVFLAIIRDAAAQRELEEQLAYQASHDALTGLPNRRRLLERIGQALAGARHDGSTVGVLYCDLDRFKQVNDRFGHDGGDRLLIEVARRLQRVARPGDTLARLGGDKFVVLAARLHDDDAAALGARIIEVLEQPFRLGDQDVAISASVGVAVTPRGVDSAEEFLKHADLAMYQAKAAGRRQHVFFESVMEDGVAEALATRTALQRALERDELELHYQPIVEIATDRIVAYEALLRWTDEEGTQHPPSDFLPVAEDTGLIVPIGSWVLAQACREAASWQVRCPDEHIAVNVNVSSHQMLPGFTDLVASTLVEHGLDPARLCIEITESALLAGEPTRAALYALKDLGVRIALDDFCTGYSALSYLREFPVDVIKIDKTFVAALGHDRAATSIVGAVVGLAAALGLGVVAEGCETAEQLAAVRALGCPHAQGFYLGMPAPSIDCSLGRSAATPKARSAV